MSENITGIVMFVMGFIFLIGGFPNAALFFALIAIYDRLGQ